jgi:hypothetical protein
VDKRRLDRSPGARTVQAPRESARATRVSLGIAANDNGAPLSVRLAEAARWAVLLAALIGLAAYLSR